MLLTWEFMTVSEESPWAFCFLQSVKASFCKLLDFVFSFNLAWKLFCLVNELLIASKDKAVILTEGRMCRVSDLRVCDDMRPSCALSNSPP